MVNNFSVLKVDSRKSIFVEAFCSFFLFFCFNELSLAQKI